MHDQNWQPIMRAGKKLERGPRDNPPCAQCPKVPDEIKMEFRNNLGRISPCHAVEWTPESRRAWGHYWETKSGCQPAQDAFSREMCGQLERMVSLSTRRLQEPARITQALLAAMGKG